MSDENIRTLERRDAAGDEEGSALLKAALRRVGRDPYQALVDALDAAKKSGCFIPEFDIQLRSSPIVAHPRNIRTTWSPDALQDFVADFGVGVEAGLVTDGVREIGREIRTEETRSKKAAQRTKKRRRQAKAQARKRSRR